VTALATKDQWRIAQPNGAILLDLVAQRRLVGIEAADADHEIGAANLAFAMDKCCLAAIQPLGMKGFVARYAFKPPERRCRDTAPDIGIVEQHALDLNQIHDDLFNDGRRNAMP